MSEDDNNIKRNGQWLDAMKDRLDGYPSEGAKPFDWSRLEAAEPAAVGKSAADGASKPRRRWIAWGSAAAAAVAACLALVFVLNAPRGNAPAVLASAPAVQPEATAAVSTAEVAAAPQVVKPKTIVAVKRATGERPALLAEASAPERQEALTSEKVPENEKQEENGKVQDAEMAESAPDVALNESRTEEKVDYKHYEDYFAEAEAVSTRRKSEARTEMGIAAGNSVSSASIQGMRMMSSLDKIERLYSSSTLSDDDVDAASSYLKGLAVSNVNATSVALEGMTYDYAYDVPVIVKLSGRMFLGSRIFIETGLTYTRLGTTVINSRSVVTNKQRFHYLGVPVEAGWAFVDTRYFTSYISAGAMAEKCVYAVNNDSKVNVKPMQYSLLARVGAQFNPFEHLGIFVEPGFTYYFNDGSDYHTSRKENPAAFTVTAGLRFTL